MKDEIKEILDKLQKVSNRETASRNALMEMEDKDYQLLLDYITNLQEENKDLSRMCELYSKSLYYVELTDYKSRIEKTIDNIDITIELIKQQPTEDDTWILDRLNGFKYLLQGVGK